MSENSAARPRSSIRRKLLTSIVAYSSLVALFATALNFVVDYRSERSVIEDRLEQIRQSYTQSLSKALWHMDREAVTLQLEGIQRFPDIERVEVVETDDGDASSAESPRRAGNLVRSIPLEYDQQGETHVLGAMLVEVNLGGVYSRLVRRALLILATQTLTIFLVSGCIFLIVQHVVTRHLVDIARQVRGVDAGNLGQSLVLDRDRALPAEIADVALAIDSTGRSLRDSMAALTESRQHVDALNRDLEARIAERTRELQDTVAGLQVSERRFRDIAESSGDWIWETDARGRFIYSNDVVESVLGFTAAETLARSIFDTLVGAASDQASEALREAFAHGKRLKGLTAESVGRAQRVATETALVPVHDDQPAVVGYRGVTRDISERRRAERALEDAHRHTVELSRAAGKAEVATGVLHNMGNTLNGATVSVSLLRTNPLGGLVGDLKRAVDMVCDHEADLAAFVNDHPRGKHLLPFLSEVTAQLGVTQQFIDGEIANASERLEHMQRVLSAHQRFARVKGASEQVALGELFEDALRINEDSLARHQIRIVRDFADPGLALRVDKHRVLEILTNLLLNAKDALIASEASERTITLRARCEGERAYLAVVDNGVGIPESELVRIFSYGFTTKAKGNGFGLHSCANAARELGGDLQVQSAGPGQGAEFRLILPVNPGDSPLGGGTS